VISWVLKPAKKYLLAGAGITKLQFIAGKDVNITQDLARDNKIK
jgi:hypothetical protein